MKRWARAVTRHPPAALCVVICVAWIGVSRAQGSHVDPPFGGQASFRLNKAALRISGAPASLVDSLSANAYRYFRMLARQFAARTCFEFRDLRWRLPSVAVHGDAHIEQFVTTSSSFGLEDFDMAGFGPSVVDLVRYAASIHIACAGVKWPCNADEAVSAYFDAYREALDRPVDRTEPRIAGRLRAAGAQERHAWLQWAESLIQPMPSGEEEKFRLGWPRFVQLMHDTRPDRPEGFYQILRVGGLHMGTGSALEAKTLIRIAGPSDEPDDDVMLEARSTVVPDGSECVWRPMNGGSLHVLMLTALLGPRLPDVFGFLPREGARQAPELWIQSWDRGYRELSIADLESQAELNELAVDAARQLAGHFWTKFPEPLRGHQRFGQLRALEMVSERVGQVARNFAREAMAEWERFRRQR